VREDLDHALRINDGGEDLQAPCAARAGFGADIEEALSIGSERKA